MKTSIEGKGVTVSSSATLDDYADLVDSIEAGGGGTIQQCVISRTDGIAMYVYLYVEGGNGRSNPYLIDLSSYDYNTIFLHIMEWYDESFYFQVKRSDGVVSDIKGVRSASKLFVIYKSTDNGEYNNTTYTSLEVDYLNF